jgi:hypothetical protein
MGIAILFFQSVHRSFLLGHCNGLCFFSNENHIGERQVRARKGRSFFCNREFPVKIEDSQFCDFWRGSVSPLLAAIVVAEMSAPATFGSP